MVSPQKLIRGNKEKIFLLKHKYFAKTNFKNTFSVSGQRCGQAVFITVTRFGRGAERALVVGGKKQPFRLFF
jgi:hypothetical protein